MILLNLKCILSLQNVATISSGNDAAIGQMIADALDKVRASLQPPVEHPFANLTSPHPTPAALGTHRS